MKRSANIGVDMKNLKSARLSEPRYGAVLSWVTSTPDPADCLRMSTRIIIASRVSVVSVALVV
jgi:hypothetical protein